MVLPIQYNPISLGNVQVEYGGTNPIGINEYYGQGNAPASGSISLGDFHQTSGSGTTAVTTNLLFELDARNSSSWPGSGTTWYDTTSNSRNFTLINGPTGGTNSVVFDGTNDYAETANGTWIPSGTAARTAEFYVKMHTWRTNQVAFLLSKTAPSNQAGNFGFQESSGNVYLGMSTQGGGTFNNNIPSQYQLSNPSNYLNSWHQYVFTYDGSIVKIYIDGTLVWTSSANQNLHSNTAPQRIMCFDPSNSSFSWNVDGEVGIVRMYNTALTATQISTNYSNCVNGAGPVTPTAATLTFSPSAHTGSTFTGTFSFDKNVGDFTTGDVTVTGGSKGTFTQVTGSEYTLSLTPSPSTGNMGISVPANAAYTAGNLGHNAISQTISYTSFPSTNLYMRLNANDSSSYGGSGTTWYDTTSNNNDFALQNGPVFNSTSPKHFDFDGSNDWGYRSFSVSSTTDCTWIIWFRMDSASQNSWAGLFGIRYGTGSTNILGFKNSNEIQYHWNNDFWYINTGLTCSANTWYMISLRVNSTSGRFDLKYGTTTDTYTNTASHGTFSHSASSAYIARDPESSGRIYNGDISDIMIWTRRLSDAEVNSVYSSTKGTYGY